MRESELTTARLAALARVADSEKRTENLLVGRFLGVSEDGQKALVSFDGGAPCVVNSASMTVTLDTAVAVLCDSAGRPVQMLGPIETTSGKGAKGDGAENRGKETIKAGLIPDVIPPDLQEKLDNAEQHIADVAKNLEEAEKARKAAIERISGTMSELDSRLSVFNHQIQAAEGKADEAAATAATALTAANGKNKIWTSHVAPPASVRGSEGDVWWQIVSGVVTGQWRYSGGAWVETQINTQVIANLDVAKLTAGTATVSDAVINKLWVGGLAAKTAAFQQVIIAPGNLIENGYGEKNEGRSTWTYSRETVEQAGIRGVWATTSGASLLIRGEIREGESHVFSWWVRANSYMSYKLALRCLNSNGKQLSYYYRGPQYTATAVWRKEQLVIPTSWLDSGTTRIELVFQSFSSSSTRITMSGFDLRPQVGAVMIADGSVNADKLSANAIQSKHITATEDITGKRFVAGSGGFWTATSTNTRNNVAITSKGLSVYKNGREVLRVSDSVDNGLAIYNQATGRLESPSSEIFGLKSFGRIYGSGGPVVDRSGRRDRVWFDARFYSHTNRAFFTSSMRIWNDDWRICYKLLLESSSGRIFDGGVEGVDASCSGSNGTHLFNGLTPGSTYRVGFEYWRDGGQPGYRSAIANQWPVIDQIHAIAYPSSMMTA
ncbi:hypothetical protein ACRQFN_02340 [Actinotignum sp. GS-2025e]|uniref:hypothetical protein n=1 Tax=unclassified Actinotignum TaxID=2632702 RepID=UPI003F44F6D2